MDRKTLFEMYGKYYNAIQSLASFPILEIPTVDKVFNNKSLIQSVYRDMKDIGFKGTALEYIVWLSTAFFVDAIRSEVRDQDSLLEWALTIIDSYARHKPECKNLWRNWAYYLHFPGTFFAEIKGLPYPSDAGFESDWGGGDIGDIKEWMRVDAALSAFGQLVVYEDNSGKMREDHGELVDFIKKLVTAKVE